MLEPKSKDPDWILVDWMEVGPARRWERDWTDLVRFCPRGCKVTVMERRLVAMRGEGCLEPHQAYGLSVKGQLATKRKK